MIRCFAVVLSLVSILLTSQAYSKDLYLTNSTTTSEDTADYSALASAGNNECEFDPKKFFDLCGNLKYTQDLEGAFKDISALPVVNEANGISISVVRYNMKLGRDLYIPFSLLSSEVTGSLNQEDVNSLKLIDSSQGRLNLQWNYAGRYKIGGLCDFDSSDSGGCTIGANFGVRYLALDKSIEGGTDTEIEHAAGAYFELANSWNFPILRDLDGPDAGSLTIKLAASYFYQNIGNSVELFPNKVDLNGEKLMFDDRYYGYSAIADFNITDQLSIQLKYFDVPSHDHLDQEAVFAVNYAFD